MSKGVQAKSLKAMMSRRVDEEELGFIGLHSEARAQKCGSRGRAENIKT